MTKFPVSLLLFAGLFSAVPLTAQPPDFDPQEYERGGMEPITPRKRNGGYGYFSIGYQSMQLTALNERLQQFGYPTHPGSGLSTGGGGIAVINNIVIGGEGWALSGGDQKANGYLSTWSGGGGIFQVGYMFGKRKMSIYPLIGFGGVGNSVKIRPDGGSMAFDTLLTRPGQGVEISGGGAVMSFSLNSEFKVGKAPLYVFGLQAGWIQGLGKTTWNAQETTLTNGPELKQQGWYVRLKIGAGIY